MPLEINGVNSCSSISRHCHIKLKFYPVTYVTDCSYGTQWEQLRSFYKIEISLLVQNLFNFEHRHYCILIRTKSYIISVYVSV